jgi:acylglycerol lipase
VYIDFFVYFNTRQKTFAKRCMSQILSSMNTKFSESFVQSSAGFMVQRFFPELGRLKAIVVLVHGMGEHPGRYSRYAESLAMHGIGTIRYSQQGHAGRLQSKGHCQGLDSLMDDLASVLAESLHSCPIFIFGHSMGGTVVANYILKRKPPGISGVILSSPYFELAFEPPAWKIGMANLFSGIWPGLTQPTGLNINHISRIPAEVERYKNDPEIHGKMSAAFFQAIHPSGKWALSQAAAWHVPVLIGHGLADRITSAEASQRFFQGLPSGLNRQGFWPEQGFHELHHEPERDEWLQVQVQFINDHSHACNFPF